jgi:hypothetical protein
MKTRYRRLSKTNRMHFLKPYESFCKIDGADGYLDSDTSCKRYVYTYRVHRMKFLKMNRKIPVRLILIIRGNSRKSFFKEHYDDTMIYSNRRFWFYRNLPKNMY